ncbi:MAG TPA: hypothetical protein VFZ07_04840, partial [Dongiaceae bacterium]
RHQRGGPEKNLFHALYPSSKIQADASISPPFAQAQQPLRPPGFASHPRMIGDGHRKERSIRVKHNGFWRAAFPVPVANMQQAEPCKISSQDIDL